MRHHLSARLQHMAQTRNIRALHEYAARGGITEPERAEIQRELRAGIYQGARTAR